MSEYLQTHPDEYFYYVSETWPGLDVPDGTNTENTHLNRELVARFVRTTNLEAHVSIVDFVTRYIHKNPDVSKLLLSAGNFALERNQPLGPIACYTLFLKIPRSSAEQDSVDTSNRSLRGGLIHILKLEKLNFLPGFYSEIVSPPEIDSPFRFIYRGSKGPFIDVPGYIKGRLFLSRFGSNFILPGTIRI